MLKIVFFPIWNITAKWTRFEPGREYVPRLAWHHGTTYFFKFAIFFLFFFFFWRIIAKELILKKRGMYLQCHLLAEIPPFNYVMETINLHKNTLKIANHTQICWKWCYFWAYLLQTYLKIKVFHHFPYHICANFITAFLLNLIFGLFLGFESSDNLVMD